MTALDGIQKFFSVLAGLLGYGRDTHQWVAYTYNFGAISATFVNWVIDLGKFISGLFGAAS